MFGYQITRKNFLKSLATGVVCLTVLGILLSCSGGNGPEPEPNFIIIFTDDQGYGDIGVFGATDIATPNLDRMADEGVQFTNFYVGSSVCTPSRAALLTGSYPKRIGLQEGVLFPRDTTGLHPDEITIADLLKEKGYATACIGKWHLGRPETLLPTSQGFDSYFGIPYSNDLGDDHPIAQAMNFPPLPLMQDEGVIEAPVDQINLTKRYNDEAVTFIKNNKHQPFFLYLAHNMPHYPCYSSEDFQGSSQRGSYGDAIQEIDWSVGQIIQALKDSGIDDRTLIVFTSDNGPWEEAGEENFIDFMGMGGDGTTGSALPLSGWKRETLEGGMRVPAIMRWPGRLPAGAVCEELATTMDLLPTLAVYAESDTPSDRVIDGKDISNLLENPETDSPHTYFYYYSQQSDKLNAIRDAEGYKLHLWRELRGLLSRPPYETEELYYLPDDIGEEQNIFADYPEKVAELRAAAEQFDAELILNTRPIGEAR